MDAAGTHPTVAEARLIGRCAQGVSEDAIGCGEQVNRARIVAAGLTKCILDSDQQDPTP
jgi:hypothetical protein